MPLEQANYIHELVESNPVGSTDLVSEGDDHLRLIKKAVKQSFPAIAGAVTATHTELSFLNGVTGTTGDGELVLADGAEVANFSVEDLAATGTITLNGVDVADYARQSQPNTFTNLQTISRAASEIVRWRRTDADTNQKGWAWLFSGAGGLRLWTLDDANALGSSPIVMDRSGTTVTKLAMAASTITLNGVDVADYARKSAANEFEGNVSVGGTLSGNGSGLTNLNASALSDGEIPADRFPDTLPVASGKNLTNLNASALTDGNVPGDRLGGNQTMSGNKTFSGDVTISGVARKGIAGGFLHNASANNLGGRITISSTEATTAAQVGSPGDMRFVYL